MRQGQSWTSLGQGIPEKVTAQRLRWGPEQGLPWAPGLPIQVVGQQLRWNLELGLPGQGNSGSGHTGG